MHLEWVMKKHLLAAAVALVPHVCAAQTIAWSNEPGSVAVARDLEDAVYTARWDFNPAGDIHVAKRDAAGMLLWESHFDNQDANRHEVATFIATDGEGNALVSGTIRSGISNPVNAASVLMKFSPDGQLLWRNVYGANFDGSSTRRVVMDGAGRAHVVGLGVCPAGLMGTVRQYGADGSLGWVWCDDIGIGAPTMIKRTPDGQFVIASRGITGSAQGFARIDSAGHTVWSLAGIVSPAGGDIAGDAAGNSYIVHAAPNGGPGSQLRKLSPTGEVLWKRAHPMSAFRVELGADGAPVISGFPNSGSAGAAFAKFDPEGTLLWTNASSGPNLLMHSAMQIDADGSAYLSGSTLVEMGVAKVNADGSTAWFMLLPGGATSGMVLGSQGQVYVSGGIYTARIDQVPVAVVFSQGFEP
jgi:hypothetical protein